MEDLKNGSCDLENFYECLNWCYENGEIENIEGFLLSCEERLIQRKDNKGMLVAVYNELGAFYRLAGRYDNSLEAFRKAENRIKCRLGTKCMEYATLLNNMAGTYRHAGQYDKALEAFHKAIEIYRWLGEEESYACASVYNNISVVYQEIGRAELAIYYLKLAIGLTERTADHKHETPIMYSNLTALYHKAGKGKEAIKSLEDALGEFEKYRGIKNEHYGAVLNSLGGLLFWLGMYQRAIVIYKKAAEYTEAFFGRTQEYGTSYQNMYWVYKKTGEKESAVWALLIAEKTYLELYGSKHEYTITVQNELRRIRAEKVL